MSHIRSKKAVPSWIVSESGKRFALHLAQTCIGVVSIGHVLPHTALSSTYRDFVRLYNNGFTVPVPEKNCQRFKKALELLQIDEQERYRYKPFLTCGFDLFSCGTFGRFDVNIGIPVNFTYDNVQSIDKSKILVNQESVVWESDEGKQLLKSLLIPENAQIYAMAREIKERNSWKIFIDTSLAVLACSLTYLGAHAVNTKLNLYNKPQKIRFLGYGIITAINLGNYIMLKDLTQSIYEEKIDKELMATSPVFVEGGKQFYSQILERNKALRVLMGKEGERKYTALGNENSLIRTKHIPIVQRKAFFEEEESPAQAGFVTS